MIAPACSVRISGFGRKIVPFFFHFSVQMIVMSHALTRKNQMAQYEFQIRLIKWIDVFLNGSFDSGCVVVCKRLFL